MHLSLVSLFVLVQSLSVLAQTAGFDSIISPPAQSSYVAGSILPIVWQPGTQTGTVSIVLTGGTTPETLSRIVTVGKSVDNKLGGLNWTIPSNVGSFATYGLNLTLDSDPNNTFQSSFAFHITGGSSVSSTSTGSGANLETSTSTSASGVRTVSSTISGASSTINTSTSSATSPNTSATGTTSTNSGSMSSSTTSSTSSASTSPASGTSGGSANIASTYMALLSAFVFLIPL
ncbi:hypothetical protein BKA65DRAFT_40222 [Rhexocercosporidium sp. MPI-PUGE-AT-0058]|nr:hypothetical protein BKA65DRAFT_40222 [Rhexocercosporidium sp. MPI-PUGE-AT-0058]